jgi:RNA polymerase sigma-70 factor (ECF subfamily)
MSDLKPDSGETSELLDELRQGQPAFDRLFTRHRDALRATVSLRFDPALRGRLDPSDVVQDTQMEAFRRLPEYLQRQPMPFHLWLRKMAYERLIMMRRKHLGASCRAVGSELPLPEQSSVMLAKNLLANEKSPSQQVETAELAQRVRLALAQLPDTDREILLMRTFEMLSYDDIACVLDIESATARKRYGRALLRLHGLLVAEGITGSKL